MSEYPQQITLRAKRKETVESLLLRVVQPFGYVNKQRISKRGIEDIITVSIRLAMQRHHPSSPLYISTSSGRGNLFPFHARSKCQQHVKHFKFIIFYEQIVFDLQVRDPFAFSFALFVPITIIQTYINFCYNPENEVSQIPR